jgi:hypothetical protein
MALNYDWAYKMPEDYAVLSTEECYNLLKGDAPKVTSSSPEEFARRNQETYYVFLNTWLLLAKEFDMPEFVDYLSTTIRREGVLSTIAALDGVAFSAIQNRNDSIPEDDCIPDPVIADMYRRWNWGPSCYTQAAPDHVVRSKFWAFLQLFRFGKRLTFEGADVLNSKALDEFEETEKHNREMDSRDLWNSMYLSSTQITINEGTPKEIRGVVRVHNLNPVSYIDRLMRSWWSLSVRYDSSAEVFFHGAVQDACNCPLCKRRSEDRYLYYPSKGKTTVNEVTPMGVPKSHKASRIVSPEKVESYSRAARMFKTYVWDYGECKRLRDQRWNMYLASLGAATGSLATVDLSHGSDYIRKTVIARVSKACYHKTITLMPQRYVGKRKTFPLSMFATGGNAMTFVNETEFYFCCAACASTLWYLSLSKDERKDLRVWDPRTGRLRKVKSLEDFVRCTVAVYGDDVIIFYAVYPTLVDVLTHYGCAVNEDKTFSTGNYRESCGVEWFQEEQLDIVYWPRKVMNPSDKEEYDGYLDQNTSYWHRMVSLSNRILDLCWPLRQGNGAPSGFLLSYIRKRMSNGDKDYRLPTAPPEYGNEAPDVLRGAQSSYLVRSYEGAIEFRGRTDTFRKWGMCKDRVVTDTYVHHATPTDVAEYARRGIEIKVGQALQEKYDRVVSSPVFYDEYIIETKWYTKRLDMERSGSEGELQPNERYVALAPRSYDGSTAKHKPTCINHGIDGVTQFSEWDAYHRYLEYGPRYNSDLDRLLGVSISRKLDYQTCTKVVKLTKVEV